MAGEASSRASVIHSSKFTGAYVQASRGERSSRQKVCPRGRWLRALTLRRTPATSLAGEAAVIERRGVCSFIIQMPRVPGVEVGEITGESSMKRLIKATSHGPRATVVNRRLSPIPDYHMIVKITNWPARAFPFLWESAFIMIS